MKLALCIHLALAVLVCGLFSPSQGQNANATIKGTVTDPSAAAVAGAAGELIHSGTREHRQATTSSSGDFDFAALPPGDRADLGQAYNGQTFIHRANPLDNDFLNNIPRNSMTGPGFYNIDSSFYKVTSITERVSPRLEAQIFNLLNHKNFALPNNAGIINAGVGPARIVQFQGRIDFSDWRC